MHELGVVMEVLKTIERIAEEQKLTKIDTLVLQIGELSSMVPKYIKDCFPVAVYGTIMEDTKLEVEVIPGSALCKGCNKVFNIIENGRKCPNCASKDCNILSGREFMIKEIIAY